MEQSFHFMRLPPEVGEQSIGLTRPKDLCNLMVTSSSMRTLADNPNLWSAMKVNKQKIQQEGLKKLFSINRFKNITKIDLSGMEFTSERLNENLNAILSSTVEVLNLENVMLGEVPAELLAKVAGHLTKIDLYNNNSNLTTEQCLAILETCVSSSKLVEVNLYGANLRKIPPEFLGHAIGHLRTVKLGENQLKTEHYLALLKNSISSSTLTNVTLNGGDLREVPAHLFGRAAGHLHTFDLAENLLETEQCLALLESCVSSSSLIKMTLTYVDDAAIPPDHDLLNRARDTGRFVEYPSM